MAVIKQVERVGCGFVNMDNYRRRIMAHIAVTRRDYRQYDEATRSSTESRVRYCGAGTIQLPL